MHKPLAKLIAQDARLPAEAGGIAISGVTSDSRQVRPGFAFVAIPGAKADGASFIPQALKNGASVVVVRPNQYAGPGVVVATDNPRRLLALMAARLSGVQPETVVAVTGTNGKTSVAVFVRQIWAAMGFRAASLGTIGLIGPEGKQEVSHTTPDAVVLHALAAKLRSQDHVKHLVVEASSHGLEQHRLDGLEIAAAGFTNITRDHLDYHPTFDDYFSAKMRLFDALLPQGGGAVINMDSPAAEQVLAIAKRRKQVPWRVGRSGDEIRLLDVRGEGLEQHIKVQTQKAAYALTLPLVGDFQVSNALVAAGLVIAAGGDEAQAFHALESLKGALGRLDLAGRKDGASIFIDYAHTPDALETALKALRPFARKRLVVVFGCGGDRDKGKRPLMGEIASRLADLAIVTDDNPRSEDAGAIRRDALAGANGAKEIGDRAKAIRFGVEDIKDGDVLLVAGKGHEQGQTIGTVTVPFSDHEAVAAALRGEDYLD